MAIAAGTFDSSPRWDFSACGVAGLLPTPLRSLCYGPLLLQGLLILLRGGASRLLGLLSCLASQVIALLLPGFPDL